MKKRFILMCLAVVLIVGQVHAIDFSWGASFGFGKTIFRGDYAEALMDLFEQNDAKEDNKFFSASPTIQTDLIFGILPYLALETGLGYRNYIQEWKVGSTLAARITSQNFIIPVMVRGKYDFGIFSVYASIGPKFIISFSDQDKPYLDLGTTLGINEGNSFFMDLGFAIGFEVKLNMMYIGIRGGYDLNLLSPMKDLGKGDIDFNQDNLNINFTLRRVF